MKKKILVLIAILLLLGGSFRLYQHRLERGVYAGTIEATLVDISAQVSSRVSEVLVKEGQNVEEGAPLFKLACEDLKVSLEQAKRDWERAQKLRREGSISQESYEHAQNRFQELQVKNSWCDIPSPLKGTVLATYREKGELVLPGQKLLTIADLNDLWCYIYLSASEMKLVNLGKKLTAYLPQFAQSITVKVIHINAQAEFTPKNVQTSEERERLVYGVKVQLDKSDLHLYPGMNLEVKIENAH
ncbi:MAG: efflux RND transporter periplasmic adaptor subunit [Oligoflexia bacterium]|nr:efflux RND transporter periplasmic adaptor subunit [Oligoflexia bacterium]MBF0365582.1 efflux RND transporter periplasmic adaptor subunit [Oligoflexia bacterium]